MAETAQEGLKEALADLLNEEHPHEQRRAHSLSNADILTIGAIVQRVAPQTLCSIGFTAEEAMGVKKFIRAWNRGTSIVGTMVLVSIVGVVFTIFGLGFWSWIKRGGAGH